MVNILNKSENATPELCNKRMQMKVYLNVQILSYA